MALFDALYTRKSIRKFIQKPIPAEPMDKILYAGIRAPSGGNRQPWVENAPAVIVVCVPSSKMQTPPIIRKTQISSNQQISKNKKVNIP